MSDSQLAVPDSALLLMAAGDADREVEYYGSPDGPECWAVIYCYDEENELGSREVIHAHSLDDLVSDVEDRAA